MKLMLRPVDTWFFRDSTPFTQDASPQQGVPSVFPPYPPTVVGAIRAELARRAGWNGRGRWDPKLDALLGDGPENLGALDFIGPFVIWKNTRIFPMPLHLLGVEYLRSNPAAKDPKGKTWSPKAWIRPGSPVHSDLGSEVELPEFPAQDDASVVLRQTRRHWVTQAGLACILRGKYPPPTSILFEGDLWAQESRVGIMREQKTRAVKEGALYSTRHVRLKSGVTLGMEIAGWPEHESEPCGFLSLGGESRLAAYQEWKAEQPLFFDSPAVQESRVAVIVLTPLFLESQAFRGTCDLPQGLRVICAVAKPPVRIGGWDSLKKSPLPLKKAIMPGSVLYCNIWDHDRFTGQSANGLIRLGRSTQGGFGLCALGSVQFSQGDVR